MHTENIGRSISLQLKNIAFSKFPELSEFPNVISPFSRMYLITEGSGYLVLHGKKISLEADHLYLIPSFNPCTYVFFRELAHIYIHVSISIPNGLSIYNFYSIANKVKASAQDSTLFTRLLKINPDMELPHVDPNVYQKKPWINKEINYESFSRYMETTGIIQQLLSRFTGHELAFDKHKLLSHNMQKALIFIQQNIAGEISVKQLADEACFSKDHFTRLFKSITGIPPREFIIRKRIETAQMFLLTTNLSLNQIIERSGFKTTAYFCRIFKKYTSLTPLKFRKSRGQSDRQEIQR